MSTKAQPGKNKFKDELEEGRYAAEQIRKALDQLIEEPGPQSRALLIAKSAVALSKILAVLNRLDEIGRNARNTEIRKNGTLKEE